ncbi:hypothetical protein HY68_05415 [Streptomyces sp. AcH 505]|uniref:hypothetical protein n=1 Tax=Streptomyces sp. AcH 505 TaxID=352211 RepID=UPI000591E669|nr:hypothetical protein HY68_05415 [Streptomyces sp. AcH 505]
MRTRAAGTSPLRSIALAVAAGSLLLGCTAGTSDGASERTATSEASASSTAPVLVPPASPRPTVPPGVGAGNGKVLSQGELDRAVLAGGDVPGFDVGPMDPPPAQGERAATAACAPLTAVINGKPEPVAKAVSYRQITGAANGVPAVSEFLTAHGPRDAGALLSRLRTAVTACARGFRATGGDSPSTYTAVRDLTAPQAGDESLKYQVTGDFEGDPVPLVFHVVRVGGTVATFYTANLEGASTPDLPRALVAAQVAKLR